MNGKLAAGAALLTVLLLGAPARANSPDPAPTSELPPGAPAAPAPLVAPDQMPAAPALQPPPSAAPAPQAATPPPKPRITLRITVNLTSQKLTVQANGQPSQVWPISSGRMGYATPPGTYNPQWRARDWYSRTYDYAPMPYSVFFHNGYAIHGTTSTGMLGQPASHGCIRLSTTNAATLYNLVGKHGMASTQIVVQGTARHPEPQVARDNDQPYRTRYVDEDPRYRTRYADEDRRRAYRGRVPGYAYGSSPFWTPW